MRLRLFTVSLLGTALLAICGCGNDTSDRFFSLPSDPPGIFIEARFHPHGMQNWKSKHLTILGDGAAALQIGRAMGASKIYEFQLSDEEVSELLDLVLQSGVMEHDPARTRKADFHSLGELSRDNWSRVSGPALTVHVLETNCPGRAPGSPVTAKVRAPVKRGKFWNPTVESLAELGEKLSAIQKVVEKQGNDMMNLSD